MVCFTYLNIQKQLAFRGRFVEPKGSCLARKICFCSHFVLLLKPDLDVQQTRLRLSTLFLMFWLHFQKLGGYFRWFYLLRLGFKSRIHNTIFVFVTNEWAQISSNDYPWQAFPAQSSLFSNKLVLNYEDGDFEYSPCVYSLGGN